MKPHNISRSSSFSTLIQGAVAVSLLVFATGCGRSAAAGPVKAEDKAVAVETVQVTTVQSPVLLRLTGNLRGARETELAANVSGRVLKTLVERGAQVKEGDLLAQVDTRAAQLALAEAKVSVKTSVTQNDINLKDCERYAKLKASGVVTDQEYDAVTAKCTTAALSIDAAQARERMLAKNVGDGMIRSPFSGVVTDRFIEIGEYVQSSSRVVALAQVQDLKLLFQVPERNFPDVKRGAAAHFSVAAYGELKFEATVAHISGAVSDTRDILVEATVDNQEGKLLPGMFADVELVIGTEELPSIPMSATFEQNGKVNVMVVSDKKVLEQRIVQVARQVGQQFPVRRGLKVGDVVVKAADAQLKNGQKVL